MARTNTFARTLHEVGIATWFGGSPMGAVGVNAAAGAVDDPRERARVANEAWARWTPVNLAAIGAYLVGGTIVTLANRGRVAAQRGVARNTFLMTGLAAAALGATAYARVLGQRVMEAEDPPVASGTTPTGETPPEVASAQRQLKVLQWAIPALTGSMMVMNSRMGEQQRPTQVAAGVVKRLVPERLAERIAS